MDDFCWLLVFVQSYQPKKSCCYTYNFATYIDPNKVYLQTETNA